MDWFSHWPIALLFALNILGIIAALPCMLQIAPSVLGCAMRMHESENLAHSVSQSRSRDYAALALLLPSVMIVAHYNVYPPLAGANPYVKLLLSASVFAAYALLKFIMELIVRNPKLPLSAWKCVCAIPRTFFVLIAAVLIFSVGVLDFFGVTQEVMATVLRCEMAVLYALCLVRQMQFFAQHGGIVAGFLYLCALEIFPLGILIVSAVFL